MITLHVEDYCHNCPDFEAETISTPVYTSDSYIPQFVNTGIYCAHCGRCKQIADHIRREMEGKTDDIT